ncbi:MAG TPA: M48 family metallopeptidase [Pyrinomonadaceae bacterium]|nr:M48 family metallopeptidase [Pyrinomonadaceae bacterium]
MNKIPFYFIAVFVFCLILFVSSKQNPAFGQNDINKAPTSVSQTTQNTPVAVPEPTERAMAYYNSGIYLWIINTFLGVLIPFLFLQTKVSAWIRDVAERVSKKWILTLAIYFIIFTLINFLISLPMDFYLDYVRQHDYGLSNQTFSRWLTNSLIQLLLSFGTCLFLWIPYLLLRKSPRRWWLYTSILLIPFYFLVMLVTPVFIDPLFNNFGEMKNKALETKILALADRAGIEGSRVYVVDKSVDTNAVNAYVTGFMHTKRIVLWDTIISKLDEDELLFVVGHEMGHYVLGHVVKGLVFLSIMTFVLLFLVYRISNLLTIRFGKRWGFTKLSDPAAMPMLILVVGVLTFVFSPLALWYSRDAEHEADRFAIEITRNNHAGATAFVKLQTENLSNPRPSQFMKFLRASHPPIGERIDFCNEYKPWEKGEPLKYSDLFK